MSRAARLTRISPATRAKIERALRITEEGSALNIVRALAHAGVREEDAGRLLGEGRDLLAAGGDPEKARCRGGAGSCPGTVDLDSKGKPEAERCSECEGDEWIVPSLDDQLRMRLALANGVAASSLAVIAGESMRHILRSRDARYAGAQSRLIPVALEATDPDHFAPKGRKVDVTVRTGAEWSSGLAADEIDCLPPEALERLHMLAAMQRMLDEQVRAIVEAAKAGSPIPEVSVPVFIDQRPDFPRREA